MTPPSKSDQQKQADQKKLLESPASDTRLQTLKSDIAKTKGVKSVSEPVLDKKGTTAILTAIPTTAPSDQATEDLVDDLRDNVIPKAVKGTDLDVSIGGQTAGYIDLAEKIGDKLPSMILIVVGLSFIVLMLAFRSILLPLKAAVCNLLSVGAAYGVVTFVFQEGHGAELLGLDGPVPIVSFAPLLMFAILFGLSMDYEVFLLTQIQEHWKEEGKPTKAVVDGLASTGRVITSAALIMVCVFTSFILNGDPTVKEFGVGLAVAIAIDATLVRCLLVPAIMVLMGKSAWWLPELARPRAAEDQHRGRGLLQGPPGAAGVTASLAQLATEHGRLAIDTEFVSERRYQAQLCLVQVAVPDPSAEGEVRTEVLDPLGDDPPDPQPLADALADPGVEVIVHAGRQDVAIMRRTWSTDVTRVFDTQVGAGFLGFGNQEGYESLVERVLGVKLKGGEGFTRWDKRPLTEKQLSYAADDARCLLALGSAIESKLSERGRLEWAREECRAVEEFQDVRTPERAYEKLPKLGRLDDKGRRRRAPAVRVARAGRRGDGPAAVLRDPRPGTDGARPPDAAGPRRAREHPRASPADAPQARARGGRGDPGGPGRGAASPAAQVPEARPLRGAAGVAGAGRGAPPLT